MTTLRCVAQWQEMDAIVEGDEVIDGFFVNGVFVPCDIFVRYGTPWVGEAPEFRDVENYERVPICAVSTSLSYPYYVEIEGDEVRVWEAVGGEI